VPFNSFALAHGTTGLPEILDHIKGEKAMADDQQKELLKFVFENEKDQLYTTVVKNIQAHFGVGRTKAIGLLTAFRQKTWIIKDESEPGYPVYKLMI
jgi:hypothetical protein